MRVSQAKLGSIPIVSFQNRNIQDLAWVIRSMPMISGNFAETTWWDQSHCEYEYQSCYPYLKQLDLNPELLDQHLAQLKTKRLGERFEALVYFWLTISPNYDVLCHQQQIQDQQRTLGEIDFLIRERKTDAIIHLEVAVKFYLAFGDLNCKASWHGTNLKDRLDIKFERLVSHQTQLSRLYPELMPYPIDQSACLLKGRLFYPLKMHAQGNVQAADFAATDHLFGFWSALPVCPEGYYIVLNKSQWLSPLISIEPKQMTTLPTRLDYPQCFARWQAEQETQRLFLLPENFPTTIDFREC